MKNISNDIKNGDFKHIYLLFGNESYLRIWHRNKLVNAIVPPDDNMNRSVFSGKNIDEQEIIDIGETLPFFSEKRLIFIRDSGFFKSAPEKLGEYLKNIPDYLYVVFEETEIDKRSALYRYVSKHGYASEFEKQSDSYLLTWIGRIIAGEGKKIKWPDAEYFLSRVGTDMNTISLELDKVINFIGEREIISREDIDSVTVQVLDDRIFDMIRDISSGKRQEALRNYADLMALKEPPLKILALLERQYNHLLRTFELRKKGIQAADIAKSIGVPAFAVRNYIDCMGRYTREELLYALEKCASTEQDIKTGNINDRVGIELLIIEFSSLNKKIGR